MSVLEGAIPAFAVKVSLEVCFGYVDLCYRCG